ncbi:DEAD/DEAH box helicase [soil metagenome]
MADGFQGFKGKCAYLCSMSTQDPLSNVLKNLGITALHPMQERARQAILEDKSVLLLAPTGSGKTLAFLLPVLQLLQSDKTKVQCLILSPTRELAIQIESVWKKMGTGFKVNACYGGHSMSTEIQNLSEAPALLVGTPGRIADHLTRKTFDLDGIHILILDEFDKSLEMGFQDQMAFIMEGLTHLKKTVLVSATKRGEVPEFTKVVKPTEVNFIADEETQLDLTVKLVYAEDPDKISTLFNLLCSLKGEPALIFFNQREPAEEASASLNAMGLFSTFYHGGMEQDDRERALIHFRNGSIPFLLTTDLAARGLDIPEMKHVIHVQLPQKNSEFIHRNGRTARAKASGTSYVLLNDQETKPSYLKEVNDVLKLAKKYALPPSPEFLTLYISGGRKNKINKIDIVGFLSQKGKLEKEDIGLLEVKDFFSFAAVKKEKVKEMLKQIKDEKMKGKKYKIEVANMKQAEVKRNY